MQKWSINLEHQGIFIECINQNIYLFLHRNMCLQLGDFHIKNTLIHINGMFALINFNQQDSGDSLIAFHLVLKSIMNLHLNGLMAI